MFVMQPQQLIRHFTPNWFTVNMGTGVVALLLSASPIMTASCEELARILWLVNIVLFILFFVLYSLRWLFYFHEAKQIFQHSSMAFFFGAIPMGLATIINGLVKFMPQHLALAEFLWGVDVILAVIVAVGVPMLMFVYQQHQLNTMTAIWLLPIVTAEVVASSGGVLLAHLPASQAAMNLLFGCYVLWGMSVLPAFAVLTILLLRLALHRLPEAQMAMSVCLALGPIGTGALALLLLGQQAPRILAACHLVELGHLMHYAGIWISFILLGFGLWWFAIALFTIYKHSRTGLSFNLGWWGLTFPLGVFDLAILNLAQQIQSQALLYIGFSFAGCIVLLWIMVMVKTIQGVYRGSLFFSPCLMSMLEKA
jgi:C4-dicarboxylate transporter/malic acid transport protein